MCKLRWIGVMGLLATSAAWAGNGQIGVPATAQAPASLIKTQQEVARHKAEVRQLQQHVVAQESDDKRARQRLQEQDRTIAELRKKLQALQVRKAAGSR